MTAFDGRTTSTGGRTSAFEDHMAAFVGPTASTGGRTTAFGGRMGRTTGLSCLGGASLQSGKVDSQSSFCPDGRDKIAWQQQERRDKAYQEEFTIAFRKFETRYVKTEDKDEQFLLQEVHKAIELKGNKAKAIFKKKFNETTIGGTKRCLRDMYGGKRVWVIRGFKKKVINV